MSAIRFFMDEDVYGAIAPALRRAGIDALSTPEAGRGGDSDESQLDWASGENRAMVTLNVGHFAELHAAWMAAGRHHAGIVLSMPAADRRRDSSPPGPNQRFGRRVDAKTVWSS